MGVQQILVNKTCTLVGDNVVESPFRLWQFSTLQSVVAGAFSYISPYCEIHFTTVGRYCSVGDHVAILSDHPLDGLTTHPFPYERVFPSPFDGPPAHSFEKMRRTIIGNDVWIGSGAKIKTGVRIGDGAIIAAGAVVTKDVAPYTVMGGVPAKLIRRRFEDAAVVERLLRLQWWRYNLVGQAFDFTNPERAMDQIETAIAEGFQPFEPGWFRIFRNAEGIAGEPCPAPEQAPG